MTLIWLLCVMIFCCCFGLLCGGGLGSAGGGSEEKHCVNARKYVVLDILYLLLRLSLGLWGAVVSTLTVLFVVVV